MSTLAVTTIESLTDETPPVFKDLSGSREMIQGAWTWASIDGSGTVSIRDSFNVASVTDLGTGNYKINFSTSMPNTFWVPSFGFAEYQRGATSYSQTASDSTILLNNESTSAAADTVYLYFVGHCNP
jgi:hypothetical protein